MVLGVDFDNTIVCYDDLFHRIAVERGLIPAAVLSRKNEVRDHLRRGGQERQWTELQGYVYGPRMVEAQPFPGVLEFFARSVRQGLSLHIISHKTPTPVVGPAYDLHQTARNWLTEQGFFDVGRVGLSPDHVHFGVTREEKIGFIRKTACTHFVDDLEETFLEESFPEKVVQILFGHRQRPPGLPVTMPFENWAQISQYVFPGAK
jgi:hypothetical protein